MSKQQQSYRDWNWVVDGRLAQGAYPGAHPGLFQAFDVVVYVAKEAQPKIAVPPGKLALYCPMDDDIYRPVPPKVGAALHATAEQCAKQAGWGKKVLITCIQGKNRSGLLMGLTLLRLFPSYTPDQAIALIRRRRKLGQGDVALANTMFSQYLMAHGR